MPALVSSGTASVSNIYPALPDIPPVPTIPGAYQSGKPDSPSKAFPFTVSNDQFEDAGAKLLAEMSAKFQVMNGGKNVPGFGTELLKGKKAEIKKLVSVQEGLGEGGWGLANSTGSTHADRYAEAHRKEFAR